MKENQSFSSEQILLMNQLYRLDQKIDRVHKTIFIYQLYDSQNLGPLTNLHAIASKILDPQIKIQVIEEWITEHNCKFYFKVNPESLKDHQSIKIFTFQLEQQSKTQFQWEKKVQIYDSTLEGTTVRIVAIPLAQHFFKGDDVQSKIDQVQNMKKQKQQDTKLDSHETLKKKQAQWDLKIHDKTVQYEQQEEKNHLQMFRLQALRTVLTNKTQLISLCGLIDYASGSDLKSTQAQLASIFKFPKDLQPQYLLYSFNPKPKNPKMKIPDYVNSTQITTTYNLDKQNLQIVLYKGGRQELFKQTHFTSKKQVSISLYSIRLSKNNPFMATAIQKFTNGWSTRVSNAIIPIGFVVTSVYEDLKILQDPSSSNFVEADSFYTTSRNIQLSAIQKIRFSDLFQKYNSFQGFYLEDKIDLKDYYTLEKFKISKLQPDEQLIPRSIDKLTFLFYFTKLNKQFLQKFTATENQGFEKIIDAIDRYIQEVCELINHINDTLLATSQNTANRCQSLRKYLQFIKFLLNSTILVKNITNKALALTGNIKNFFDALKLKDNWIVSYIISNEESIEEGQPIHYYDFLLRFIRNDKKQKDSTIADDENIGSIFVTIHKFKADQIAKKFIWDKSKVVQAVKSYSQNILKYEHLMSLNKRAFDKFQIEKKVARLLCVVGLAAEAAKIYQRLHMIEKVEECFKQILLDYRGEQRTYKLFEFAQFFEDQFAYTIAQKYYQKAYCTAKTTDSRKKAQASLLQLRKRQASARADDVTIIKNYTAEKGSEDQFVKTGLGIKQRQGAIPIEDGQSQYKRLLMKLSWDESKKESVINDFDDQPSILSK